MTDGLRLERVPYEHPDAVTLRDQMVAEVSGLYGAQRDHDGTGAAGGIDPDSVVLTVVGYLGERPVAHVLVRRLRDDLEIKRMYVAPDARGLRAADALMAEIEDAARSLGARRLVLHTGERQLAAIRAYERQGFTPIPVYEPYVQMPESLCFEKQVSVRPIGG